MSGWIAAALLAGAAGIAHRESRRRAELVARACHELRGPLTAAGLAVHAAGRRKEAAPRRLAAVELQLRRAELALADLARAPSGRRARERAEAIGVAVLLRREVEAWREVALAHGCDVRLATPLPVVSVRADARRISQAAGNLIANALEAGARVVVLGARLDGGLVRIEVRDDGPGLPAPIAQLSRPRGERGRGLAIAGEIAARHGGALRSAPSEAGAHLVLELPVA